MGVRLTIGPARAALAAFRREVVGPAIDFLYPPVCFLCEEPLDGSVKAVCAGCWSRFAPARPDDAVWRELRERACDGGPIDGIFACWLFEPEGPLKEAIHLLKYRRIRSLGVRMGGEIGRGIASDALFAGADLLVPVPLHRTRRRERGYNQSALLCDGISAATGIPTASGLLRRTRYTESQTLLDQSVRHKNVEGAFELDPAQRAACKEQRIILVDDVVTTGATVVACAALLREAAARSVLVACAALAR